MKPDAVRVAQAQLDAAAAELKAARTTLDSAAAVYDAARKRPGGLDYEKARAAWALALQEWTRLLIRHAGMTDRLAVERRRRDLDPAGAPPGGAR